MHEMGIESSLLNQILAGNKTIEGRLGKPRFLKIRVGNTINLREDVWNNGKITQSIPNKVTVRVTQLLYFESFDEMFSLVDYRKALPMAASRQEALSLYRNFYSREDEEEYGVVAITFSRL